MFLSISKKVKELILHFDSIPSERKVLLQNIANYIQAKKNSDQEINLIYICTHNSRRSHFGQIWSAIAADFYKIDKVNTFSGGTETTSFNSNAINTLKKIGLEISSKEESFNPKYLVKFGENKSLSCYSKKYDDKVNPSGKFAAIMTCSDAEENCPYIPGAELRIATSYEDPKKFDGTNLQDKKYLERSNQIALECFYVFSLIQ